MQAVNNKGADRTAQMCRLICAFVVHILHKAGFLMMRLISWIATCKDLLVNDSYGKAVRDDDLRLRDCL